jgi:hypothetical protein
MAGDSVTERLTAPAPLSLPNPLGGLLLDRPRRREAAGKHFGLETTLIAEEIHLATDADTHTLSTGTGGVMSKFERLLEAGSTELPDCRCAAEMNLMAIVPTAGGDTEIRIFRCPTCSHELRLTAWRNDVPATT